ncbi:MAG: cation:dicarboxylase symporter family transporter, partial [Bacilli bacterium]|nr:cation:dicarboxylase symporter family transporter [Bacilli bacterium]
AVGFGKTFIVYTVVALLFYFIVYSLYAFIAGGAKGFKAFWANILPATATAISTCSSAASIPVNTDCAKKIGVSNDIAETMIPLGTSFHKDGSVIGSVFKIMFLVYLFGTHPSVWTVLGVALLATLLVTAVPVGGGTISETLILTMMGFPLTALPILTIIATIIDPPATLLNVVGDTSSSMLVSRVVDGKDWMKQKTSKKLKEA